MIPKTVEEVLEYLELIDSGEAEYAKDMVEANDYNYTFEHRLRGGLTLESDNDTFFIHNRDVWTRVVKEGTTYDIYPDEEINSAIYLSRAQHYCIIVGLDFPDLIDPKREVPPL